ncbi:hypothetical protein [Pseudoduganella lutea]|uniref:Uncharacterized protein n=1 Tax=Pseudoduganella lutea TaxID=321985 RepID=A0A4P6KTP5_9BURK|nr:hypothetical protein [Pseudoduganella lutea]QBE61945.1 hypothetical protein EWM63_02175 [Pseudoduganella lutea]
MSTPSRHAAELLRLTWNWLPARYAHRSRLLGGGKFAGAPGSRAERALSLRLLREHGLGGLWRRDALPYPWLLEQSEALHARAFEAGLAGHGAFFAMQLTRQARRQVADYLGEEQFARALDHAAAYPALASAGTALALDAQLQARLTRRGALLLAALLPQDDGVAQRFLLRFAAADADTGADPAPTAPPPEACTQLAALMDTLPVRRDSLFDWVWHELSPRGGEAR